MAKLTIIVGMGGSGKSHLCDEITSSQNAFSFKDATLTNCDRRRAGYDCLGEIVARLLLRNENCVMDEAHLTNEDFRRTFKSFCGEFLKGVEQEWVFFENDALGCINTVYSEVTTKSRVECSRFESLANQIPNYKVPEPGSYPGYAKPRPVFQQSSPHFHREADVLEWLHSEIKRLESERCR